ncbi:MAG: ABC transporter ATP-binding protein [Lachnospiraceae bacterium]|nr:ABC transporter ATP-binding protein [Lachnospiraceae bacterium]
MIEVTDLVKRYGDHTAIDGVSFTIQDGLIYGLLGPNGAGKTTTMNILTGYLCANEGKVVVNGYDILKQTEKAKAQIGYLPEIPPLYEDMTVREYLGFVCELKKAGGQTAEEIERVCKKTGIEDVSERLIRNLSKGYKQRVGIAQALIGSPAIIILDEPTVGLDPLQIIEIRDLIRELKTEHTVILSSHILSEVSAVCDEIMIISHGKLVAQDSAENLSRLSEGRREVNVTVKGSRVEAEAAVKDLAGVASFETKEDPEGTRIVIEPEAGCDIREDLFFRLADARLPILHLSEEKASLEEIFIELTREDKATTEGEESEDTAEETSEEASEEAVAEEADRS